MTALMSASRPSLLAVAGALSTRIGIRTHRRMDIDFDAVIALRLVLQFERVPCLPQKRWEMLCSRREIT